jgi:Leucine-rich repeat (LRR) protein
MNSLRELNARKNNIASLSGTTFPSFSKSLKSLHLQSNPSMVVSEDAFARLTVLEELFLDGAQQVQLSQEMFSSQQRTLRSLSFRGTNIGSREIASAANSSSSLPWSTFRGLTALQNLYLTKCSLAGAVPDFVFVQSANLHTIDLSDNAIDTVSQRSLAGLQSNLTGISLANNRIQTLDQCVFYRFTGINIFQVYFRSYPASLNL